MKEPYYCIFCDGLDGAHTGSCPTRTKISGYIESEQNHPTPSQTPIDLTARKKIMENERFAIKQIDGGHRSERALEDLLAYAKQLQEANARHVLNHIENICEVCGHTKTEDGCAFCIKSQLETELGRVKIELHKLANRQPKQMDKVEALKTADEIVKGKYLFKKFISGTPLENDIAVWMAEFAAEEVALASFPTTVEEVEREEWRQERKQLTQQLADMREVLKTIEWKGDQFNQRCPDCRAHKFEGHHTKCTLNKALNPTNQPKEING